MGLLTLAGALAAAGALSQAGPVERLSVDSRGTQGNGHSWAMPLLAPDGMSAAFMSSASNLVLDDRNRREDIFVRDRRSGRTLRVVRRASGSTPGPNPSYFAGHRIGFPRHGDRDEYYLRALHTGATTRLDVDSDGRPVQLWLDDAPAVSEGAAHFAFTRFFGTDDHDGIQIYVRDGAAGTTAPVSAGQTVLPATVTAGSRRSRPTAGSSRSTHPRRTSCPTTRRDMPTSSYGTGSRTPRLG